jgi:flavin-dependent dehydrogenase
MLHTKYMATLGAAVSLSLFTAVPALAQGQVKQGKQDTAQVEKVLQDWKKKPQQVARDIMKKYGPPQEVTMNRLIWHNNGPWKRTELENVEIDHKFPLPHKDMLMQVVAYNVPADKFDELAQYDGSVIAERTRGELAARCDKEAANILALNLAHEIINGKRSVEEAKKEYGEQIVAFATGKSAPLTQKLNFQPQKNAGDPGHITLAEETVEKTKAAMKQKEQKESASAGSGRK